MFTLEKVSKKLDQNEENLISEAEHGRRNIPLTTNLIILLISKLFGLSIKVFLFFSFFSFFKAKLKFYLILLQFFDISPKLNANCSTKTSSFQRSGEWFEGPCPISLSVT